MTKPARPKMTIIEAIEDRRVFGRLDIFRKRNPVGNWITLLKAIDGLPLDDVEFKAFRRFTGRTRRPAGPFWTVLILVGRRGGKSLFAALKLVHAAVLKPWPPFMGEGHILCLAADKAQAGVIHGYVRDILRQPAFRGVIARETSEEIELRNRITIGIHSANYRTIRGMRILAVACDEMSFWLDSESSRNPAGEVLTALEPALGETAGSQLIITTTPYLRSGPVFELHRDYFGKDDPDVLVWQAPTVEMNPTYRTAIIDKAMARDPAKARAEFYAEFRSDLETYVPLELVTQAVVPGRVSLPYSPRTFYHAFVDPSELVKGGDSMTLAISHNAAGRLIIDRVDEVRPPADPKEVVERFVAICQEFRITTIIEDRVSLGWIRAAFEKHGIAIEPCSLPKSDLYGLLSVKLQGRIVEIPDDKRLVDQIVGLEKRNLTGGVFRIDHAPGGHDDRANAVAGAIELAAAAEANPGFFGYIERNIDPDDDHDPDRRYGPTERGMLDWFTNSRKIH